MKLKNILFSIVTFLFALIGATVNAETTAPSSFKVNSKDLHYISTSYYLPGEFAGGGLSLRFKKNADGVIIYCTEIHDYSVTSGSETYTLNKELDARYAYVIEHGYPNSYIFGSDDKDYFTTGLAIWYLSSPNDYIFTAFDLNKGTFNGKDSDIVREMAKLINGANNYKYIEPSITINNINSTLSLSKAGKYYESSKMSIKTEGKIKDNVYEVVLENAPKGTIIVDTNGNSKTSFSKKEEFIIKVPVSSVTSNKIEFNVNVNAKGVINKAYQYNPSNPIYQNVAVLYPENKNVKATTKLNLELVTEVQISKIDATTNKELPGAHLVVKDANGKVKKEWTSTEEVYVIKGLKPGKYTLTETIAPEGYVLSTETITFEVKSDGTVTKVVMKNYLEDKPVPVSISKRDITTGEELPGAHLELKDETGEFICAWVSTDEPFIIKDGLKPGKYILSETIAPEGYELSTETITFIVKEDGTVDGEIIMYNKPETIEVPNTSSFKTITASLIGVIIIGLGSFMIYKNYKKNEEK